MKKFFPFILIAIASCTGNKTTPPPQEQVKIIYGHKNAKIIVDSFGIERHPTLRRKMPLSNKPASVTTFYITDASTAYKAPATINMTANVLQGQRADFYNGPTLIGTDMSYPFAFTWKNVPKGIYYLYAKGTNRWGSIGTSNMIKVTVGDSAVTPPPPVTNQPPTTNIIGPLNNSTFTGSPNAIIDIDVAGSDPDGTIAKTELYINGAYAGVGNGGNLTFEVSKAPGTYTFYVKATDDKGATGVSPVITATVKDSTPPPPPPPTTNQLPTVNITYPANNTSRLERTNQSVTAVATDPDGTIANIDLFVNGINQVHATDYAGNPLMGSFIVTQAAGTYTMIAKATDNSGGISSSPPITITFTAAPVPPPPPPPSGNLTYDGCVLLNFNGGTYSGSMWGVTTFTAAQMTDAEQQDVVESAQNDYSFTRVLFTRDPAIFNTFPANKRLQCNITSTYAWYPNAGGVSYVGSFNWGDGTPNWVFSPLLGYSTKMVGEAVSHECGHAAGLHHSNDYGTACTVVTTYYSGIGTGNIGFAPVMGNSYYKIGSYFDRGEPFVDQGCAAAGVDQVATLISYLGQREDDWPNDLNTEPQNPFPCQGTIEKMSDVDALKVPSGIISVQPYTNDKGEDPDVHLLVKYYNSAKQLISTVSNDTELGVTINSTGGYITVETRANAYHTKYGMLGKYIVTTKALLALMPGIRLGDHLVAPPKEGR